VRLCELGHEVILVDEGQASGRAVPSVPGLRVFANTTALGLYPNSDAASGFHLLCCGARKNLQVSFERLVVATGAYTRLPLVPGSTTPGVISLPAYERMAGDRALPKGTRLCVFGPGWALRRAAMAAAEAGSQIVMALGGDDLDASLSRRIAPGAYPERIEGGDRVRRVTLGDGSRIECDLMIVAYEQPSYELQMQAGQRIALRGLGHPLETEGETPFPMLVVGRASGGDAAAADAGAAVEGWLAGREPAGRDSAVMPQAELAHDAAVLCPCEDVTVGDIRAAVRDGFDNVEHVKRRTGAGTGPCQGKLCHAAFVGTLVRCGVPAAIPTVRPLCRPACLGDFSDASHG
jgi:bacterioferritin-associated ferredoxin